MIKLRQMIMCRICSTYWRDDTVHATFESEMSKQETVVRYEHACMGELLHRYRRRRVQDCGMGRSDSRYCSVVGCLNVVTRVHVSQQAENFMGT